MRLTALLCALSCCVATEPRAAIVTAVSKYTFISCVQIVPNDHQDALKIRYMLSQVGIWTGNCSSTRFLHLLLSDSEDTRLSLSRMSSLEFSNTKWLVFLRGGPERITNFFSDINVPINCEFLVVQRDQDQKIVVSEVYRVAISLPLVIRPLTGSDRINMYTRRNDLQGLVLRCKILPLYPLLGFNHNTLHVEGYFGEVWNELQNYLNFKTVYGISVEDFGVELPNGSWSGLIGTLVRGEADITCNGLQQTPARLKVVDFLIPIMSIKNMVFIRRPGLSTNWDNFLSPFDSVLWSSILVAIIVISASLSATWYIMAGSEQIPLWYILYESVFRIFGNFLNQGFDMNISSSACRAILVTSYLTTTVLLAAYSAALISYMTVQDLKLPFRNYEELLNRARYTLGAMAGSAHLTYFDNAPSAVLRKVYNELVQPHLRTLPHDAFTGLNLVCTSHKYAFFTAEFLAQVFHSHLPCDVVPVRGTAFPSQIAMVIRKNSPYKDILNYYTKHFFRSGILKRLYHHTNPLKTDTFGPTYSELDLKSVKPLLAILGIGIVTSILILLCEITVSRLVWTFVRRKHKKRT